MINHKGKNNPMYGKKHIQKSKIKMRLKRLGTKHSINTKLKMSKNSFERKKIGFIRLGNQGYLEIKINKNKWVLYHRYLAEKYIGYKLKKGWIIHHIDGNKTNNRLSNLYIFKLKGLHYWFEGLVRYKIIDKYILKSNLKELKKRGLK